jgi:hypothetical protein
VEFTPAAPDGERLSRLEVAVDGEVRDTLEGDAIRAPLRVPLARSGLTRVTLVGHADDGRLLGATRDYII